MENTEEQKQLIIRLMEVNSILEKLVPEIRVDVYSSFKSYIFHGVNVKCSLDELNEHDTIQEIKAKSSELKKSKKVRKKTGTHYYILDLIDEGFFKVPKIISQVKEELALRGYHIPRGNIGKPLQRLCQQKKLRRSKSGAQGNFTYSNW